VRPHFNAPSRYVIMFKYIVNRCKRLRRKFEEKREEAHYKLGSHNTRFLFSRIGEDVHAQAFRRIEYGFRIDHYLPTYKIPLQVSEDNMLNTIINALSHEEVHCMVNDIFLDEAWQKTKNPYIEEIMAKVGLAMPQHHN